MEVKKVALKSIVLVALILWALPMVALPTYAATTTSDSPGAKDAASVSDCMSQEVNKQWVTPSNCLFLEEPIGGKPGYDLYVVDCLDGACKYKIWNNSPITGNTRGPLQAVLTRQAGKEYQGPFGLLYNYLSLIYNYMSGMIIGISVLFVVVGGIQISTSKGEDGVNKGKNRIIQAIAGIILWFTASLILYTINPTFFGF